MPPSTFHIPPKGGLSIYTYQCVCFPYLPTLAGVIEEVMWNDGPKCRYEWAVHMTYPRSSRRISGVWISGGNRQGCHRR